MRGDDLVKRPIRGHLPRVPEGATTPGRWVDVGDIRVGDEVLLRDGRILPVQAIRHQPYCDKVYNFHVEEFECYAVGRSSVLVHNTNAAFKDEINRLYREIKQARQDLPKAIQALEDLKSSLPANEMEEFGFDAFKEIRIQNLVDTISELRQIIGDNMAKIDKLL